MKKIWTAGVLGLMIFSFLNAEGQARMNVNVNIGQQPAWGPRGYDYAEYYYMPDIGAYYYVPQRQFIYSDHGRWVTTNSLPRMYRNYDLYRGRKIVINEPRPYLRNDYYQSRYSGNRNDRVVVRNVRHDDDYGYGKKNKWKKQNRGRGNAYGHYK